MLDGDNAPCLLRESARGRDQVEKAALSNPRVGPGPHDLSHHRDGLRSGFVHENGNVRAAHKASILQPLLDQLLRFIDRQLGNVNIVDQGKIDVSGATDTRFAGKIGHSEHTDLDQIANAQLYTGIGKETGRLGCSGFLRRCRQCLSRERCLGEKTEAAQNHKRQVRTSKKEAPIPPHHTKTPESICGSSLAHTTQSDRPRALGFTDPGTIAR